VSSVPSPSSEPVRLRPAPSFLFLPETDSTSFPFRFSSCLVTAAKQDKYLYLGGPLLAGVTVVALSSLAPMVLPVTAMRTLAVTEALSLYGGLAVFSGFMLYDTQRILKEARMAAMGLMKADPVGSAISLELNTLYVLRAFRFNLSTQADADPSCSL
jgi:hypothetical protein